jgi:hypothetical protein
MPADICIDCDGKGRYPSGATCKSCGGSGRVLPGDGIAEPHEPALLDRAMKMRNAIDMIEGAIMALPDFVDLPKVFDGARPDLVISPKMTVGQMLRVCQAVAECTRIINSDEYTRDALAALPHRRKNPKAG